MIIIYTTCKNKKEAQKVALILVKLKLAACVNFWSINSIYSWKGKNIKDQEVAMFIKTKESFYKKIETLIRKIHSYETPCIVACKIDKAEKDYLKWLNNSLK